MHRLCEKFIDALLPEYIFVKWQLENTALWTICEMIAIETLWLLHIEIWLAYFTSKSFVFSVIAGWISEMLFVLFFAYIIVWLAEHT